MNQLRKHRTTSQMAGYTILAILVMATMARCVPVETSEQMGKDIGGLTDAQKVAIMAPMQHKLYPGRLP